MLLINVCVCELLLCSVLDLGLYLHWNITYVCVCIRACVCVCVCVCTQVCMCIMCVVLLVWMVVWCMSVLLFAYVCMFTTFWDTFCCCKTWQIKNLNLKRSYWHKITKLSDFFLFLFVFVSVCVQYLLWSNWIQTLWLLCTFTRSHSVHF